MVLTFWFTRGETSQFVLAFIEWDWVVTTWVWVTITWVMFLKVAHISPSDITRGLTGTLPPWETCSCKGAWLSRGGTLECDISYSIFLAPSLIVVIEYNHKKIFKLKRTHRVKNLEVWLKNAKEVKIFEVAHRL